MTDENGNGTLSALTAVVANGAEDEGSAAPPMFGRRSSFMPVVKKKETARAALLRRQSQFGGPPPPLVPEREHHHEKHRFTRLEAVKQGLWRQPVLIVEEEDDDIEREISWTELFFDLIIVTGIQIIGDEWAEKTISTVQYTIYFLIIWQFWIDSINYGTRFNVDDLSNKLYYFVSMFGLVGVCMHLRGGFLDENCLGFALSCAFLRFLKALVHLRIGYHFHGLVEEEIEVSGVSRSGPQHEATPLKGNESKQPSGNSKHSEEERHEYEHKIGIHRNAELYGKINMVEGLVSGMLWIVIAFSPSAFRIWLCVVQILINDFWIFLTPLHFFNIIPWKMPPFLEYDVEHFSERMGCILIIALGESIAGICVDPTVKHPTSLYIVVVLSFCAVVGVKLLYFDVNIIESRYHALRQNWWYSMVWCYMHHILGASIAIFGDAMAIICRYEAGDDDRDGEELLELGRSTLLGSCSLILAATALVGHFHSVIYKIPYHSRFRRIETIQLVAHLFLSGVCFAMVIYLPPVSELSNAALLTVPTFGMLALVTLNYMDEIIAQKIPVEHTCGLPVFITDHCSVSEAIASLERISVKEDFEEILESAHSFIVASPLETELNNIKGSHKPTRFLLVHNLDDVGALGGKTISEKSNELKSMFGKYSIVAVHVLADHHLHKETSHGMGAMSRSDHYHWYHRKSRHRRDGSRGKMAEVEVESLDSAVLQFPTSQDAEMALAEMNKKVVQGLEIELESARFYTIHLHEGDWNVLPETYSDLPTKLEGIALADYEDHRLDNQWQSIKFELEEWIGMALSEMPGNTQQLKQRITSVLRETMVEK